MKITCPKCKTLLEAVPAVTGTVECPSCGEALDLSSIREATCPVCCTPFAEDDSIKLCPDCKTPHHAECWEENRGCSTYGCASAWHEATHTEEAAGGGSQVACPACGAMHPATDLVCSACGKLLDDYLPGDNAGARIRETIDKLGSQAKMHLLPRLARNFGLLGKDVALVFRLWWGEFSRYVAFGGRTTRRPFAAFLGINFAITLLFCCFEAAALVALEWLVLACPTLTACARRLRDTDMSPWMIFAVPLLPFLLFVPTVSPATSRSVPEENVP